jgi:hypothetical protein
MKVKNIHLNPSLHLDTSKLQFISFIRNLTPVPIKLERRLQMLYVTSQSDTHNVDN